MSPPVDLDRLSHAELKSLVIKLLEQVTELQPANAALRDEIARLKGGPGRPTIKPSGMEKATELPKPFGPQSPKRGPTKTKLTIHDEKTVKVAAPPGSRFKRLHQFRRPGLDPALPCRGFSLRALVNPRRHPADRSVAGRHRGVLRTGTAAVYFGAIS